MNQLTQLINILTITHEVIEWYLLWLQGGRVTKQPHSGPTTTSTAFSLTCLPAAGGWLVPGGHVCAQLHTRCEFRICSMSLVLCGLQAVRGTWSP